MSEAAPYSRPINGYQLKIGVFILDKVVSTLKQYPAVILPFIMAGLLDFILLCFLFFISRTSVSFLVQGIKLLWGVQFISYPENLLVLPALFSYGRAGVGFIPGVLFTGLGISMISQAGKSLSPSWNFGISKSLRRYLRLIRVWVLKLGLFLAISVIFSCFFPSGVSGEASFPMRILTCMAVQIFFAIVMASIIVENKKVSLAMIRSMKLFLKYPLLSVMFVCVYSLLLFIPGLIYIKLPLLWKNVFPEIVVYTLSFRILMATIIDFLCVASATILLLTLRKTEKGDFKL